MIPYTSEITRGVARTLRSKTTVPCLETGLALARSVCMISEDPTTLDQDLMPDTHTSPACVLKPDLWHFPIKMYWGGDWSEPVTAEAVTHLLSVCELMSIVCLHCLLLLRYFAGLLVGCMNGVSKEELLSSMYSPFGVGFWDTLDQPLVS